ncbi:30S ribosomal protein S6 [Caldinitratiruptor microaerophilus]|uniref:Small ribosomal subunit protein bS6 n=1 Tax=Caldinitratiruptor microaerophilus TaxID=671077 RepID=A0AA35G9U6_9FIRM|nr:30S ribosomal protein S6 [Caldinitratiruptor microaerophilus]BDG61848.1 30S ribosomal protein S6 [Caldinitratiruptor microaerophilus]
MRSYELMMVVRPDLEEEATKAVVEKAKGIITTGGGVVEKEDLWGKRRLAYEIRNFRDGYYAVLNFRAGTEVPKELDRVLRITDEVIRHIIVRPEE